MREKRSRLYAYNQQAVDAHPSKNFVRERCRPSVNDVAYINSQLLYDRLFNGL